jgi:hypothetical protein
VRLAADGRRPSTGCPYRRESWQRAGQSSLAQTAFGKWTFLSSQMGWSTVICAPLTMTASEWLRRFASTSHSADSTPTSSPRGWGRPTLPRPSESCGRFAPTCRRSHPTRQRGVRPTRRGVPFARVSTLVGQPCCCCLFAGRRSSGCYRVRTGASGRSGSRSRRSCTSLAGRSCTVVDKCTGRIGRGVCA